MTHAHITPDGKVSLLDNPHPCALLRNKPLEPFDKKPVQIRFSRELGFTIFGENFDASIELTTDEALSMASMLLFLTRDQLWQEGFKP